MVNLPQEPLAQAQNVVHAAQEHCPGLIAAYLHGSVCLGGYVPGRSDLDLLLVSEGSMTRAQRQGFADALLELHGAPCPVELSVVTREGLDRQPPVCCFHFSEMWAGRYAAHDADNPLLGDDFSDEDIPAYYRVARQSGATLLGPEPAALLPEVSDEVFWQSITQDIEEYDFHAYGMFASNILTLPRTVSFARLRRVLTKAQAGRWGMEAFPEYADLLRRALAEYEGGQAQAFTAEELSAFRADMLRQIAKGLR